MNDQNHRKLRLFSILMAFMVAVSAVNFPVYAERIQNNAEEAAAVKEEADQPEENEGEATAGEEAVEEESDEAKTDRPESETADGEDGWSWWGEFPVPPLTYQPPQEQVEYESLSAHLPKGDGTQIKALAELPASYNPVEDADYLPPTRSQQYGDCWAHAAVAAMEINLTKNHGVDPKTIDLSELQVAYFSWHRPQIDSWGLPNSNTQPSYDPDFLRRGGNEQMVLFVAPAWITAGDDSGELAYSNAETVVERLKNGQKGLDDSYAYADSYHLEKYYNIRWSQPDDVKRAILECGAVTADYYSDLEYSSGGRWESYYCDQDLGINHAIVLIGWDDDYPAENFRILTSGKERTPPSGNGAWLARNSWHDGRHGASPWMDDNKYSGFTYFWISYEDKTLGGCNAFLYEPADDYNNNYGNGCEFVAKGATGLEQLRAVSFRAYGTNINYNIEVYKNPTDEEDPRSGSLCSRAQGTTSYDGYYTVPLQEYVPLKTGDTLAVVSNASHLDDTYAAVSVARAFTDNLDADKAVAATGITIDQGNVALKLGSYTNLLPMVTPNEATNKDIIWSSSNPEVAEVSNGRVTANGIGEAVITAALANDPVITAVCNVTVVPNITITNLESDYDNLVLGTSFTLKTRFEPEEALADYTLRWESSNPEAVTVSQEGTIKAVGGGTARITVSTAENSAVSDTITAMVTRVGAVKTVYNPAFAEDNSSVRLSWKAVAQAHHYRVSLFDDNDTEEVKYTQDTDTASCEIKYPFLSNAKYKYRIQAFNENESLSSNSAYFSLTVPKKLMLGSDNARIAPIKKKVYDGNAYLPTIKVTAMIGGKNVALMESADYRVHYENNVDAGTGKVTVEGIGGYEGTLTAPFTISKKPIGKLKVVVGGMAKNSAGEPPIYVYDGGSLLENGKDYSIAVPNEMTAEPGRKDVTITAAEGSNYTGSRTVKIMVYDAEKVLKDSEVTLDEASMAYAGGPLKPGVTVKYEDNVLDAQSYAVKYVNNREAGTAFVIVTGKKEYCGCVVKPFEILPLAKELKLKREIPKFTYNGKPQKPKIIVMTDGKALKAGKDYTVFYSNNYHAAGESNMAAVTIRGRGNYAASQENIAYFTIQPQNISKVAVKGTSGNLKLTYNKRTLREGVDYIATYGEDNGSKTEVVIEGMGDFTGKVTKKVKK